MSHNSAKNNGIRLNLVDYLLWNKNRLEKFMQEN